MFLIKRINPDSIPELQDPSEHLARDNKDILGWNLDSSPMRGWTGVRL